MKAIDIFNFMSPNIGILNQGWAKTLSVKGEGLQCRVCGHAKWSFRVNVYNVLKSLQRQIKN